MVQLLLRHSALSTIATPRGGGLLHAAAKARRADVRRDRAEIAWRDRDAWTAVQPVDTWQVLETALLSREALGLEVDAADDDGHTPLHVAVAEGGNELVAALLHAKASTGACAHDGCTPLQIAVANGDLQVSDHACPDT